MPCTMQRLMHTKRFLMNLIGCTTTVMNLTWLRNKRIWTYTPAMSKWPGGLHFWSCSLSFSQRLRFWLLGCCFFAAKSYMPRERESSWQRGGINDTQYLQRKAMWMQWSADINWEGLPRRRRLEQSSWAIQHCQRKATTRVIDWFFFFGSKPMGYPLLAWLLSSY